MSVKAALIAACFVAVGNAFSITRPSSTSWWVADSMNTLQWTCEDAIPNFPQYTVLITNPNTALLTGPLAIIAELNNFDCSETINLSTNILAGPNYQIIFGNPLNETDVLAQSEAFTIEPFGSTYPPQPTTSTAANATSTGASTPSGSSSAAKNFGLGVGAAGSLLGVAGLVMGLMA